MILRGSDYPPSHPTPPIPNVVCKEFLCTPTAEAVRDSVYNQCLESCIGSVRSKKCHKWACYAVGRSDGVWSSRRMCFNMRQSS